MGHHIGAKRYTDPNYVSQYYCSRLARLEQYGELVDDGYYFLDSDDIVEKSNEVLAELSTWLELEQPLEARYSAFKNTGVSPFGDTLGNIKKGKIVQTYEPLDIQIPDEALEKAEVAYVKCRASLVSRASNIS